MLSRVSKLYLTIGKYHRNPQSAEDYVYKLFQELTPGISMQKARTGFLETPYAEGALKKMSFIEAVREARETGTVEPARSMLNHDPYFPLAVVIVMETRATLAVTTLHGHKVEMQGPMRTMAMHSELAGDILFHRRMACKGSGSDFSGCSRHLRAYYLSCSALIEAFLYRPVQVELLLQSDPSDGLKELEKPFGNFEDRLERWFSEFCEGSFSSVKQSVEWGHLIELRRARNALMHPPDPVIGIELKETARQLNLVRKGVGGFINMLRTMQGMKPLAVADSLETAPEVRFVS